MIEVEKKFFITPQQEKLLIQDAEFVGEKVFVDEYFDYSNWSLTTKDTWLRMRGDRWELKMPLNIGPDRMVDQYREIENESEIIIELGFDNTKSLVDNLKGLGIEKFCRIETTRRKYKKNGFTIDIDRMDFGYDICEIEKMVNSEHEIEPAIKDILEYAKTAGLTSARVRGKVLEYLRRNNPAHMEAIEKSIGRPD